MSRKTARRRTKGKVLVRRICGLGDMILTLPFLGALRIIHRHCEIHLLGHADHTQLLMRMGVIDRGYPEEQSGWHLLFSGSPAPKEALRPEPRAYDALYLFVSNPRLDQLVDCLAAFMKGRLHTVSARPPAGMKIHAADYFLAHLPVDRAIGEKWMPPSSIEPAGEHNEDAHAISDQRRAGRLSILFHPGSGSAVKNWPLERYAQLIQWVDSIPNASSWIVEGPAETASLRMLLEQLGERVKCRVVRCGSPLDLALCLQEASVLVGNDSGVTHLSAALGTPTIAVFGPSDPIQWRPLGLNAQVVYRDDACRPCHLDGSGSCPQAVCPRFPTVSMVREKILALLCSGGYMDMGGPHR